MSASLGPRWRCSKVSEGCRIEPCLAAIFEVLVEAWPWANVVMRGSEKKRVREWGGEGGRRECRGQPARERKGSLGEFADRVPSDERW
jgi:hypothetical protein